MRYLILILLVSACSSVQIPPAPTGPRLEIIDHAGTPCSDPWELWCGRSKLLRCEPGLDGLLLWRGLASCPGGCSFPLKCEG